MPLYDFKCPKCEKEFEEKVSLTEFDTKVVDCPECKEPAKRMVTRLKSTSSTWGHWKL